MAQFCERIKELRIECGLKQREMADQLGLAINSYQAYEYATRYPEFKGLIAIADFFDVSLDYLVGRSDVRERR
ncbi:XRE family transcriptional regulator [Pseudoflavonifractor sp. 60]|uniref:helix-turn-helix domain-containing protein n=1 Tax=Pseudoflavonifractor sp. 60 TaxID=2304576 RepID=UPI0013687ABD|nr:helix-turn-helix transcriptional regulator [Pseudoflavonifractor sp. 60]NBI66043.1 XRE family transcriptional regulator [Pseudoflavonifractor sp. 60]